MKYPQLILLLIFGFCSSLSAIDEIDRRENTDKFKKYKARVEEQIEELPPLTNCDKLATNEEKLICVGEALEDLPQTDIDKIEEVMQLKTHNLIKSNRKRDVVKYLMSELEEKLQGGKDKKRKDQKYISQVDYFSLHKSRLTKNALLETSSFCRERVHVSQDCLSKGNCQATPTKQPTGIYVGVKDKAALTAASNELTITSADGEKTVAAVKYDICIQNISALCNAYKDDMTGFTSFHEACLFKDRIANFKTTLETTVKIEEGLAKNRSNNGFGIGSAYSGKFDRRKIDDATNITSDIANNDKFRESADLKQEFEDNCAVGKNSTECSQYVDTMSEEEFENIKYELGKKEKIQEAMIGKLSKEDLEKFAKKYISEAEIQNGDIKQKLKDEFAAQKQAIIENIKSQVSTVVKKEADEKNFKFEQKDQAKFNEVSKNIQEKADNPNAMRDNIFYSNMVNSYLQRENSSTGKKSSNFAFGEAEFANDNTDKTDVAYFQQRQAAKDIFDRQQKSSQKRGVASSEKGDGISGVTGLFDIIIFGK